MQVDNTIIALILILGFSLILFVQIRKPKNTSETALVEWLKTMQNSLDSTSLNVVKTLQINSQQLNDRLDKAAVAIRDVNKGIGEMSEIGRSMKDLQDLLKNPKLRGNIGEQVLKDLIAQMFPKSSFFLQYQFKTGDRVDAAIQTDAGILPIDSKFPIENFKKMMKSENEKDRELFQRELIKDVKKHIDDISSKYILPEEGTMDFCLMYIPSENVFYQLAQISEIEDYARKRRVYPVSPNSLYIHLQTILLSFEGKKIESKSKEVFALLRALKVDYQKVNDGLSILGRHITNASSQFTNVSSSFEKIGSKLDTTKSLEKEMQEKIEEKLS